jgi:amino acid adenylation domain-containing protein
MRGETVSETERTIDDAAVARQRERSATRLEALFNATVVAHPDAVAVIAGDEQLSYRELQQRAMVLARQLRALGVKPGELVGLCTRRSVDMVVGALGILMAGGAYVPLDPEYPAERLGYMLDDACAKVLVSQRPLSGRFAERAVQMVYIDELSADSVVDSPAVDVHPQLDPDQLAYVIYTSGSTGRPKGVMITHRAAVNTVIDVNARFQVGFGDRALALSSLCFDLSVYDLFGLLAVGGAVVIPDPERHFEPSHWAELIDRHKITIWNSVPAFMEMFSTFAANRREGGYGSLRRVMLSGDWIAVSLPDRIRAVAPNAEVIGMGGATEVSIWSIYYPIDVVDPTWKSIPYGRALGNQTVYVLDDDLQRCDVGVSGEIYIGGDGVAVGYWNRPDLNAEKFIPDPYSDRPDGRLYRTGDLGRYFEDGDIEFLGRIDHQVKIRGFRVELGEIETALVRHPRVAEAVVVARQVASGAKSLVAFLVVSSEADVPAKELTEFLRQGLPDYMIPTKFVRIDRLPLNVNGKIDRTALPETSSHAAGDASENVRVLPVDFAPPRDEIEAQLAAIWEQELDIRPVGIRDTFLELGGDSLTAVGVFTRIEHEFRRSLPPAALLERPTIESLAELLRDPQLGRQTACLVVVQESGSRPPLICLPGISGNLWEFRRLAKRLGPDIPLYGLQPVGLDGEQRPHESIEEIAEHYLREVRVAQPTGPYYLAGYSIGGVMAYEMAQRLRAAGETVGVLALFDAPAGGFSWPMRLLKRAVDSVSDVLSKLVGRSKAAVHDPLEPVAWSRVSDIHRQALDRYVLKNYPGRVEIFRALTRPPWPHRLFHNINLRGLKLAEQGGTVHFVPGNHDQMFRDGNIEVLAKELRTCLLGAPGK